MRPKQITDRSKNPIQLRTNCKNGIFTLGTAEATKAKQKVNAIIINDNFYHGDLGMTKDSDWVELFFIASILQDKPEIYSTVIKTYSMRNYRDFTNQMQYIYRLSSTGALVTLEFSSESANLKDGSKSSFFKLDFNISYVWNSDKSKKNPLKEEYEALADSITDEELEQLQSNVLVPFEGWVYLGSSDCFLNDAKKWLLNNREKTKVLDESTNSLSTQE